MEQRHTVYLVMRTDLQTDGNFSTNSLMKAAMAIRKNKKGWDQLPFQLWSGLAPPKVEMFIWRVYEGGLLTKLALLRRRVLRKEEDLMCVLCEKEQESADHLLIHCEWSWKLWTTSIDWWGACWVAPETSKALLESWAIGGNSKSYKRVWRTLGYAIMWSIWEERNIRIFQNKKRKVEESGELVKVRLAWWAKYRSSRCPYPISTISRCITEVRDSF
ncbi:unnamed protein product [Rhodiola kirilowii]